MMSLDRSRGKGLDSFATTTTTTTPTAQTRVYELEAAASPSAPHHALGGYPPDSATDGAGFTVKPSWEVGMKKGWDSKASISGKGPSPLVTMTLRPTEVEVSGS